MVLQNGKEGNDEEHADPLLDSITIHRQHFYNHMLLEALPFPLPLVSLHLFTKYAFYIHRLHILHFQSRNEHAKIFIEFLFLFSF